MNWMSFNPNALVNIAIVVPAFINALADRRGRNNVIDLETIEIVTLFVKTDQSVKPQQTCMNVDLTQLCK